MSYMQIWSPYKSRYFVIAMTVFAPLTAFLFSSGKVGKVLQWLVVIAALWFAGWTTLNNQMKPLVGTNAIWNRSAMDIRMSNNPKMIPPLDLVDQYVPLNATLATRFGVDHWDYIFFGPHFERTLVPADPAFKGIDLESLKRLGSEYLLVAPRERPFLRIPSGLHYLAEADGWFLFSINDQPGSPIPEEIQQKLLGGHDSNFLLNIDAFINRCCGHDRALHPRLGNRKQSK